MSFISTTGHSSPKLKEWTFTERMKRGSWTCWNLSWMKSRMEAASSWPEGPVVRLCQSMSMDITWCFRRGKRKPKDPESYIRGVISVISVADGSADVEERSWNVPATAFLVDC